MKNNNEAPFVIGQRVVRTGDTVSFVIKGRVYTVSGLKQCKCGGWRISCSEWPTYSGSVQRECASCCGDVLENHGAYWCMSKYFAPIRETRTHKRIAVPEELLHIVERDTIEPVKIKV